MSYVGGVSPTNQLRITGMATGLDTDEYVKKMTLAEQTRIDKANQDKQTVEWKQEAYVDVIKDVKKLTDDYLSLTGEKSIVSSAAYVGSKVVSNNDSVISATAHTGAINGTYKVSVTQLATCASIKSDKLVIKNGDNINQSANITTTLEELGIGDHSFNIKIQVKDGTSKDINISKTKKGDEKATIQDVINNINNATIEVEGKEQPLSNYIKVSFSELTGKLSIETRETGENQKISIIDGEGTEGTEGTKNGLDDFENLFGINYPKDKDGNDIHCGQDAKVNITPPGETKETEVTKHSNDFTIDGISYSLKGLSKKIGMDSNDKSIYEETTLNVEADASESVEKISDFIEEYNKIVSKVDGLLKEKKNYSYTPLTEAQKDEMEEEQIKKWETKAKQGLLKNDNNLESMLSKLRNTFFDGVENSGLSLKDLGLSTSRDTQNKNGQIVFVDSNGYENEAIGKEKLKKALENNGDKVMEFFNKTSNTYYSSSMSAEDRKTRYNEEGVFQRIKDILKDYTGSDGILIKKAGYENTRWIISNDLSKTLIKKDKQIKELTNKLYTKQDYYYNMFSKLETAMNQMNSQQSWLAAQLGQ